MEFYGVFGPFSGYADHRMDIRESWILPTLERYLERMAMAGSMGSTERPGPSG